MTRYSAFSVPAGSQISPSLVLNAAYTEQTIEGKLKQVVNGHRPGLSRAKREYVQSLAEHFSDPNKLQGVDLSSLADADLHTKLTAVKGLGNWSVEMFQIFKLQRDDVFSVGDLAVRKGTALMLGYPADKFESAAGKKQLVEIAKDFKPYRSLVCLYAYEKWDKHSGKK